MGFSETIWMVLSFLPQEEQGHGAGTGMGADHRADKAQLHLLDPQFLPDLPLHILGVFQAIPVADEYHLIGRV